MATFEVKLPKLGESVTEGTLGKWLKKPGDKVEKYELLVEVQTDKVSTEIPSEVSGTLKEIKVQEGETVPNNAVIALIEVSDAAAAEAAPPSAPSAKPAAQPAASAPAATSARPAPVPAPRPSPIQPAIAREAARPSAPGAPTPQPQSRLAATAAPTPTAPAGEDANGGPSRATPVVRRMAAEHGIDLRALHGTGLNGRVTRQDVEAAINGARSAQPVARPSAAATAAIPRLAADTPLPLTQMRRAIASNMTQAWTAPHAHAVMEIDMTGAMRYRDSISADFKTREGFDLSPAALVVKAAVEALRRVPLVNAAWTDQGILLKKAINVGYAVALGEEGLVVPVIKNADELSIAGIMRRIRDIVDRAKAKKLQFADYEGATFTVNNTGPLGTIVSSPIVPPGQAAIISSEKIGKRVVVRDDDSIAIRSMMNLVIGFDHRVIDGATAARFLQLMREWLEAVGPSMPVY